MSWTFIFGHFSCLSSLSRRVWTSFLLAFSSSARLSTEGRLNSWCVSFHIIEVQRVKKARRECFSQRFQRSITSQRSITHQSHALVSGSMSCGAASAGWGCICVCRLPIASKWFYHYWGACISLCWGACTLTSTKGAYSDKRRRYDVFSSNLGTWPAPHLASAFPSILDGCCHHLLQAT